MSENRFFALVLLSMIILATVAVLAIGMVGCTSKKETAKVDEKTPTEQVEQEEQTEPTENEDTGKEESIVNVSFTVVEELDEETLQVIDEKSKERGYSILSQDDNSTVVMIASGEKPSGGYGIEVKTAEEKEGVVTITVEETAPAEGSAVTTALSYPYVVVKLDTKATDFIVKNTNGEEFVNLDKKEDSSYEVKEAEGTYVGTTGDNLIKIQLDGEEEPVTFSVEKLENFEIPEENAKVKISYYVDENSQNVLTSLEVLN